jgi:hypothetical protein
MTITLTREEAQQVLDALIWTTGSQDFSETGKARVGAIKVLFPAIETLRARLSEPEQEPVALPDWPERESLADLEYEQTTPEDWTEDYKQCWQQLQVCERNKIILWKHAKTLEGALEYERAEKVKYFKLYNDACETAQLRLQEIARLDANLKNCGASQYAVPEGYALIGIDALKAWGVYEQVSEACRYPVAKPTKEQDPVAYGVLDDDGQIDWTVGYPFSNEPGWPDSVPLYTAPPQREWFGLTDEEYMEIMDKTYGHKMIDAVADKLREKNT